MPRSTNGYTQIIVCVDSFSKWVEIGALADKQANTVASWFFNTVVCRFGVPGIVRVDNGREFLAEYKLLLRIIGVCFRTTSVAYPQSNGQAEAYVKQIKYAFIKYLHEHEVAESEWAELQPYIKLGLRMCTNRVHCYAPFVVCHGFQPSLLNSLDTLVGSTHDVATLPQAHFDSYLELFADIHQSVLQSLQYQDDKFVFNKNDPETLSSYYYKSSDLVMVHARRQGRFLTPMQGHNTFISYTPERTGCIISNSNSNFRYHLSHIVPYPG